MTALSITGIHVHFGRKIVLDGLSADFAIGQVTCIVGPNGAGKSTLLSVLAGLRAPDVGKVVLDGTNFTDMAPRERARRLAFLPQIPEVAWAIDVRTLIALGRTPYIGARGLSAADEAAVDRALEITGTAPLARRNVATLSGGERARVLLARALAGEPQWLLADEPLAGLDPGYQLEAATLFREMAHSQGRGVIVTLHDLHMALRMAGRVLVLNDGRILADDHPKQALSPEILKQAYGVETRVWEGEAGPVIEIIGGRGAGQSGRT